MEALLYVTTWGSQYTSFLPFTCAKISNPNSVVTKFFSRHYSKPIDFKTCYENMMSQMAQKDKGEETASNVNPLAPMNNQ